MTGKARTDSLRFSFQTPLFVLKVKQDRLWSALRIAFFINDQVLYGNPVTCICCLFWPANVCLRMCSHGRKWQKTFKNDILIPFSLHMSIPLKKRRKKIVAQRLRVTPKSCLTFLLIFECFWSFSTMRMYAQACVCWSKYTTSIFMQLEIYAKHEIDWMSPRLGYVFSAEPILHL